ncbi:MULTISPECIES: NifU family protein [unclassified Lebetimonas]|uniref:NifU family protein n=1 Tax=unclassified Lebetimonas TaxID=2648158 RepID=UPI0004B1BD32|nr:MULTISPECIES: NifU family protein [unclassified Lebetimonas]
MAEIPFSNEELKEAVGSVIEELRPMLQMDGGDVTLIDVQKPVVFVQLQGGCVGCASAGATLKYGIEKALKEKIHPDLAVMNVPHGYEDKLDELLKYSF